MKNRVIAQILYDMAELLEVQGVEWKPQAYRKAARNIDNLSRDIKDIAIRGELDSIPGVGPKIAEKIQEYFLTGKIEAYEKLLQKMPANIRELLQLPGIGPKKLNQLQRDLNIQTLDDLEKAIKNHKIDQLPGFTPESEKRLLKDIQLLRAKSMKKPT